MKLLNRFIVFFMPVIPKFIVQLFAKPYIAGSKLKDAVKVTKELNTQNISTTIDVLGEDITRKDEATFTVQKYHEVLKAIKDEKLDANISVKLSAIGLKLDKEFCFENIESIIKKAAEYNNFVRIDMEDSSCTTDTIEVFNRVQKKYKNVGIVLQAYLRRTLADTDELVKTKTNFRICKGIYVEPHTIAWKDMDIINNNFALITETMLKNGSYVGIATHDEKLVWEGLRIVHDLGLKCDQYEFQMLLGVTEKLRKIIVDEGHRMRVYVPFGEQWYAYSTRRLKENPKMAGYIVKSIFQKIFKTGN